MKILNVCKFDAAGCAYALTKALNLHTSNEVRHLAMSSHEWDYGDDIVTNKPTEIRRWIEWADIVNCWESGRPLDDAGIKLERLIMTYIGIEHEVRTRRHPILVERHGVKKTLFGSTAYADSMDNWLPLAMPVDKLVRMRNRKRGKPIVCQTPSNRRRKNTKRIMELLSNRDDMELLIVDGVSNAECLVAKATADIVIDQFGGIDIYGTMCAGGYGKSALEAMAMGIPVISHATIEQQKKYRRVIGELPYYDVELDNLPAAVGALLGDTALYREYSTRGLRYVQRFHDYPVVAEHFMSILEKLWPGELV